MWSWWWHILILVPSRLKIPLAILWMAEGLRSETSTTLGKPHSRGYTSNCRDQSELSSYSNCGSGGWSPLDRLMQDYTFNVFVGETDGKYCGPIIGERGICNIHHLSSKLFFVKSWIHFLLWIFQLSYSVYEWYFVPALLLRYRPHLLERFFLGALMVGIFFFHRHNRHPIHISTDDFSVLASWSHVSNDDNHMCDDLALYGIYKNM